MDQPKPKLSAKVEEVSLSISHSRYSFGDRKLVGTYILQLKVSLGELKELDAKLSNEFYLAHWLRG